MCVRVGQTFQNNADSVLSGDINLMEKTVCNIDKSCSEIQLLQIDVYGVIFMGSYLSPCVLVFAVLGL